MSIIGSFLTLVGIWTFHLYVLTGDKRKFMLSISVLLSSINYWDLAIGFLPDESFRKWTLLPIMFVILIAANEPIVRKTLNVNKLFIIFLGCLLASSSLIFIPLVTDPKLTSYIVMTASTMISIEVLIISVYQYYKNRNKMIMAFIVILILFVIGSLNLRFGNIWVFIVTHIVAYLSLILLFTFSKRPDDESGDDVSSFFVVRQKLKDTEKELKRSEERFKKVWNEAADIIIWTDLKTKKIIFSNRSTYSVLGLEEGVLIGKNRSSIYHPDSLRTTMKDLEKNIRKSGKVEADVDLLTSRGEKIPTRMTASLIDLRNERIILEIYRNIKKQKQAEIEMKNESERAEFYLDLLSHDIGNIHQGIYTRLQLAGRGGDDPVNLKESISESEKLVKKSIVLVKNIKLLAGLKATKLRLEPIYLTPLLVDAMESIEGIFIHKSIQFNYSPIEDNIQIIAEPIIEQVFINLLHNAVKFQEGEKAIIDIGVDLLRERNQVKISICDHGPGIADGMKEILFDPIRMKGVMTRRGLGLQLVKVLVERYNGKIQVQDRVKGEVNKGARFIIHFPVISDDDNTIQADGPDQHLITMVQ